MPDINPKSRDPWMRRILQAAKRMGVGALFFLILQIPRVRRLRRRVWAWTCVRVAIALTGGLLVWRYGFVELRYSFLGVGILCLLFALTIGARPLSKSMDEKARELGTLVALNGGRLVQAEGPIEDVTLFAGDQKIVVVNRRGQILRTIPLSTVKRVSAQPTNETSSSSEGLPWVLTIDCDKEQMERFHFDGFFAEHLAGVAASTLQSLLKTGLPVLPS